MSDKVINFVVYGVERDIIMPDGRVIAKNQGSGRISSAQLMDLGFKPEGIVGMSKAGLLVKIQALKAVHDPVSIGLMEVGHIGERKAEQKAVDDEMAAELAEITG